MYGVCLFLFFHFPAAQLTLTICGKQIPKTLPWDQEELLSLPQDAKPKPTQGNKSWALTSADIVSSHRNMLKIRQQVGGTVRDLSVINWVSVQCAK